MKQIKRIIYLVLVLCMVFASCTDQAKTQTDITTDAIEPMVAVTQKADETSEYAETEYVCDIIGGDIPVSELQSRMERYEFADRLPEEPYTINVTGLSVPVTLFMNLDCVTAVEVQGQRVTLDTPRDIYGNCNFDLFEYGGAIIIEGGYYGIGEVHILTAYGTSTVQHKDNASYYLHINDSGELYYKLLHNGIAGISQTGGVTVATSYDEFLSAEGYASIDGCNVVFDEPYESYVISDKYDLDKEFELNYKQDYGSIEEKFAENAEKYGVEVTTEVTTTVATTAVTTETTTAAKEPAEPKYITETVTFDFVRYFEGSIEVGGGTFDGDISITYTYAEGLKPAEFSLFDVSGDEDFPGNGYYEERQTHNGWRPAWATVTKRRILRRDSGDILIEYVDGENNGPVLAYWRASDDYIIKFGFSEGSFVTDADIEMLASTFVFSELLSGSCGEGVSYTFDTDSGEVRIFGTGEMSYYGDKFVPSGFAPWHYDARVKSVVIEYGVTSIYDMAFYGCTGLSNITIPQSVTSIGKNAFNGCHSLWEISIPDSVLYIGDGAFTYCNSIKEFVIPQGVTSISPSMFFACEKLEKITIPDTVTYIGYDAFERCNSLSEISIPSSVTEIGELAFAYCSSLKEITLPQGLTNLSRGTFYNCTALEKITLPEGLTSIGVTVFHGSAALLEITIPGSVTSIDETAFMYGNLSLVRAPLGSYAEQFAKNNNIEFEEVNDYVS